MPEKTSTLHERLDRSFEFQFGPTIYSLSTRTHIMGVLNVTPDSFSDGGSFNDVDRAMRRALQMIDEGADFIDVGGESTRPGSDPVPLEEEIRRVVPVIRQLSGMTAIPISIDTYKSKVAEAALAAGAVVVNDISGLTFDDEMKHVAARYHASVVIMHIKGTPKTMQENPEYVDVVAEVAAHLLQNAGKARDAGIGQVLVDPGIGFGKTLEHNLELMRRLKELKQLGYPLLAGPSRKSFIGKLLDLPVDQRLEGTAAAVTACILNGANVVRVHDVKEMKRVAVVADALKSHS
ncbi:MAG TPA: dihydropteroate synthase [Bacteroidetes bacterium]|nr:dihydropteroate synthase [Bacteroidota bacterium]